MTLLAVALDVVWKHVREPHPRRALTADARMIVPRWEWRTFGETFGEAEERLAALEPTRVDESDELYVVGWRRGQHQVRGSVLDVKRLEQVSDDGLEQWRPVAKAEFPIASRGRLAALRARRPAPPLERDAYELDELVEVVSQSADLLAVPVHKRRAHYTFGGCAAELTEVRTDALTTRTIAVESEDPSLVRATLRTLDLDAQPNVSFPRGLMALVGFEPDGTRSSTWARTRSSSTSPSGRRTAGGDSWSIAPRSPGLARGSTTRAVSRRSRWSGRSPRSRHGRGGTGARGGGNRRCRHRGLRAAATAQTSSTPCTHVAAFGSRSSAATRKPAFVPGGHRRHRSRRRLARRVRDRRWQHAVHLRPWRPHRRAVQHRCRCRAVHRAVRLDGVVDEGTLAAALDAIAVSTGRSTEAPCPTRWWGWAEP